MDFLAFMPTSKVPYSMKPSLHPPPTLGWLRVPHRSPSHGPLHSTQLPLWGQMCLSTEVATVHLNKGKHECMAVFPLSDRHLLPAHGGCADTIARRIHPPQAPSRTRQLTANYKNTINITTIKITTTPMPPPITEPYYEPGAFPSVCY